MSLSLHPVVGVGKIRSGDDLASILKETASARTRLVVTDGVFSMEGDIARLPEIVDLARRHDAAVVVDDSHGTGVLGATGHETGHAEVVMGLGEGRAIGNDPLQEPDGLVDP